MSYNVFVGTLNLTQSITLSRLYISYIPAIYLHSVRKNGPRTDAVRLFVRPSVCQTRGLWQNGRKICL